MGDSGRGSRSRKLLVVNLKCKEVAGKGKEVYEILKRLSTLLGSETVLK